VYFKHKMERKEALNKLKNYVYLLPEGSKLKRYETPGEEKFKDLFFSYFRDGEEHKGFKKIRCTDRTCVDVDYTTTKELRLLAIPYKTVFYEDITQEDEELGEIMKTLSDGNKSVIATINHLILQETFNNDKENPDYILAPFLCTLGFDGWIRVINNTGDENQEIVSWIKKTSHETHDMDEVMICDALTKNKVAIVKEVILDPYQIQMKNLQIR
jgi:hypothetical protein